MQQNTGISENSAEFYQPTHFAKRLVAINSISKYAAKTHHTTAMENSTGTGTCTANNNNIILKTLKTIYTVRTI